MTHPEVSLADIPYIPPDFLKPSREQIPVPVSTTESAQAAKLFLGGINRLLDQYATNEENAMGYTEINLQDPKVPEGHPAIAILSNIQEQLVTIDMPDSLVSIHYASPYPAVGKATNGETTRPGVWRTDYIAPPLRFKPDETEFITQLDQVTGYTRIRSIGVDELHQLFDWLQTEVRALPEDEAEAC